MTTKIILIILLSSFICQSAALTLHQQNKTSLGGFTSLDVKKLTANQTKIDAFIRERHPELTDAVLQSAQSQIVAGTIYDFVYIKNTTFANETFEVKVYQDLNQTLTQNSYSALSQNYNTRSYSLVTVNENSQQNQYKLNSSMVNQIRQQVKEQKKQAQKIMQKATERAQKFMRKTLSSIFGPLDNSEGNVMLLRS